MRKRAAVGATQYMGLHPSHPWINTSWAPVYQLTYPRRQLEASKEYARYVAQQQDLYAALATWTKQRARAYGFVVDLGLVQSSAINRQRAIQYLEHVKQRGSPQLACRAFVTPHEAVRGVMTAVFWQSPPDYPHQFFETVEEARRWALQQTAAWESRAPSESIR